MSKKRSKKQKVKARKQRRTIVKSKLQTNKKQSIQSISLSQDVSEKSKAKKYFIKDFTKTMIISLILVIVLFVIKKYEII